MDSMSQQQVVVVTRLKAREAEKRKGDDGILANVTGKDVTVKPDEEFDVDQDEMIAESKNDYRQEAEVDDKHFVKLISKQPAKEVWPPVF